MGISVEGCEVDDVSCIELGLCLDGGSVMAGAGSIESYGLRVVDPPAEDEELDREASSCLILSRAISHVSTTLMFSFGLLRYSSRIGIEEGCEIAPMASAAYIE